MLKISRLAVQIDDFELVNLNLKIADGEYFVLLGASGSGKTVFLETVAGRYHLKSGKIEIDNQDISTLLPEQRNIGFVYQNYELFPHMTVAQNIAFGLKFKGFAKKERQSMAEEMMDILSLSQVKNNFAVNLSGGEKQRTALGRALVISPKLLLLDEPMSALDYVTKQQVKKQLKQIHKQFKPTVIHVTHDIEEALFFADRIGIMRNNTMTDIFDTNQIMKMQKGDFYAYL